MVASCVATGARAFDGKTIVTIVDHEQDIASADAGVVAHQDFRNVSRNLRAHHRVVGAHIGVIGRDHVTADNHIMITEIDAGQRSDRADANGDAPAHRVSVLLRHRQAAQLPEHPQAAPLDVRAARSSPDATFRSLMHQARVNNPCNLISGRHGHHGLLHVSKISARQECHRTCDTITIDRTVRSMVI
jgi:hypothetical protein